MASIDLHPTELAYAFAYSKTEEVIGWGREPFLPTGRDTASGAAWYAEGEERLRAAERLLGNPDTGLRFSDAMTAAILALANPGVVLLAQRKAGEGVKTLTIHAAGDTLVGLTRRSDGIFELSRYTDLTAAAGAGAGFVGATIAPLDREARVEANHQVLSKLRQLAKLGQTEKVLAAIAQLGASDTDAKSAILALTRPSVAGVLSVLYCASNRVEDAETFSVATNAHEHSWIVFPPADLAGPMVLERSSVAALAARVAVGVAARLGVSA
ncbi:MAG: hypothetical protein AAGC57_07800 [Pseudomonadota bacterium]